MSRTGYRWVAAFAGLQAVVCWSLFAGTPNAVLFLIAALTTALVIFTWTCRPWGVYGLALVSLSSYLMGFIGTMGTGGRAPWLIPPLLYAIAAWKVYAPASPRSDRDLKA